MFGGEASDKKVKVLSGGERSRLAMIRLLLEPVNLLILDEPTNHLDMRSKDVLKKAVKEFDGTVIVVSHDREFLDGLVDKIYEFGNKKVTEHLSGIYEFLEKKKMDSLKELEVSVQSESQMKDEKISENKLSYEAQKEQNRIVKRIEKQISESENLISNLEQKISELEIKLSTPEGSADPDLFNQYGTLKKQLSAEMEKWEDLTMQMEEVLSSK
jgi:ATP-binding cassette subfamily F protein 3